MDRDLSWIRKPLAVLAMVAAASALQATAQSSTPADYTALRAARAQSLTRPDGWFSLVALEWLRSGDTTVGSAPGNTLVLGHVPAHLMTLHTTAHAVTLAQAAPGLTNAGASAKAGETLGTEEDAAHALVAGEVAMWVIDRGGQRYLRVKDPEAPGRVHFHGLRWYAPEAKYRVEAKWVPYTTKHTLAVTNKLGQVSQEPVPGYAAFTLAGKLERLTPMIEDGRLFFVLRDTTSHLQTDGGGRFLTTAYPTHGLEKPGELVLDFNETVNPPCAYSPFATCPLAPKENRLDVAIPAGEKRYDD